MTAIQKGVIVYLLIFPYCLWGQKVSGTSDPVLISVGKDRVAGKPGLTYLEVSLKDENSDKTLEAWEKAVIHFKIKNLGKGPSQNLYISAYTANDGEIKGIMYPDPVKVDSLLPGQTREVSMPVEGSLQLTAGIATVAIDIREEFEFDADQIEVNLLTAAFIPPKLAITNYIIETDPPGSNTRVLATLKLVVENKGEGTAADTRLDFFLPPTAKQMDPPVFVLNTLKPGETRPVNFRFYLDATRLQEEVPIRAVVIERHQKYGQDVKLKLRPNTRSARN